MCVCVYRFLFPKLGSIYYHSYPINKTFCYIFPPYQALLALLQDSTTFDYVLLRIQMSATIPLEAIHTLLVFQ
jgi:hypothetical protein